LHRRVAPLSLVVSRALELARRDLPTI